MPQVASHRVLVVDDSTDAARSMAMVLSLDGHDVQVAHDGPTTLSTALTFQPQVVSSPAWRTPWWLLSPVTVWKRADPGRGRPDSTTI